MINTKDSSIEKSGQIEYGHKADKNKRSSFSSHVHSFYELLFILQGDCSYVEEEKLFPLKKHDLVISRPHLNHYIDVKSNDPYERYNITIPKNHPITEIIRELPESARVVSCENSIVAELFKKLERYHARYEEEDFQKLLCALLTEIFITIKSREYMELIVPHTVNKLVCSAIEYINEHLFEIDSVDEISEHLFIAKNYFFRLFKREMHTSPKRYILIKRLLFAQSLLLQGEKPTDFYQKVGFNNYVSFYKRYTEYFGYPPSKEGAGD